MKSTRAPDKTLALICPKSTYLRLMDLPNEKERLATYRKKEADELEAFKKNTYEMTKTWDNTIENIENRRKQELLSKKQQAIAEREAFVKEMARKNAEERAEIIGQARKLLLYRKPLCRRINTALMQSECLRELEAQLAFRKTLKETVENEEAREEERKNAVNYRPEMCKEAQGKKSEEGIEKRGAYALALKRQIEENHSNEMTLRKQEMESEKADLKRMAEELELAKKRETEEIARKRETLQALYKEQIIQLSAYKRQMKIANDLEDRAIKVYQKARNRIQQMYKELEQKEKAERERKAAVIIAPGVLHEEFKNTQGTVMEEEVAAKVEKQEAPVDKKKSLHAIQENLRREYTLSKVKKEQERKDLRNWEMMQRFKKEEYDKEMKLEMQKEEVQRKIGYLGDLQEHLKNQKIEREREALLEKENDKVRDAKYRADQRVLEYAKEVLEESKTVRPVLPILKAVQECEQEVGLLPREDIQPKTYVKDKSQRK